MFSLQHLALYIPVHHNLVYNQFMFSDLILTTWSQPHHLPQQLPWDHAQQEQTFSQLPALQEDQQQIEQILLWCVALSLGSIVRVEITKNLLMLNVVFQCSLRRAALAMLELQCSPLEQLLLLAPSRLRPLTISAAHGTSKKLMRKRGWFKALYLSGHLKTVCSTLLEPLGLSCPTILLEALIS